MPNPLEKKITPQTRLLKRIEQLEEKIDNLEGELYDCTCNGICDNCMDLKDCADCAERDEQIKTLEDNNRKNKGIKDTMDEIVELVGRWVKCDYN